MKIVIFSYLIKCSIISAHPMNSFIKLYNKPDTSDKVHTKVTRHRHLVLPPLTRHQVLGSWYRYRSVTRTGRSHLPKLSWCAAMAGPEEVISSWEQSEQNCASGGLEEAAEWRREKIRMEEQYLANCIMDNNQITVFCLV